MAMAMAMAGSGLSLVPFSPLRSTSGRGFSKGVGGTSSSDQSLKAASTLAGCGGWGGSPAGGFWGGDWSLTGCGSSVGGVLGPRPSSW
ncbi:hypothetical protein SKAU_G00250470 [Synaphobranchus kaupii]|uniref:Uncharacterized protein n=1 Tax=Synaphobranchus kaupii TaxID=118154 RepID=A0A9Q1F2P9_SYNKA|nr:hypothetical protein SKAU_G00250470 [Synaphobranchus kaupii]